MSVKDGAKGRIGLSPYVMVAKPQAYIEFLRGTFGATVLYEMPGPTGGIIHAEVKVLDSILMVHLANRGVKPSPIHLHCYVDNVDTVFRRAVAHGAKAVGEPTDMFYGDRSSMVTDSDGNVWTIATHKEDVPLDEMHKRMGTEGSLGVFQMWSSKQGPAKA